MNIHGLRATAVFFFLLQRFLIHFTYLSYHCFHLGLPVGLWLAYLGEHKHKVWSGRVVWRAAGYWLFFSLFNRIDTPWAGWEYGVGQIGIYKVERRRLFD